MRRFGTLARELVCTYPSICRVRTEKPLWGTSIPYWAWDNGWQKLEPEDSVRQKVPKAGDGVRDWGKLLESSLKLQSMNTSLKAGIDSESESEVAQLCPTLCNPMDCSLRGSSIHGILQARILEWVAISFSRGSSQPRTELQADALTSEPPGKIRKVGEAGKDHLLWVDIRLVSLAPPFVSSRRVSDPMKSN